MIRLVVFSVIAVLTYGSIVDKRFDEVWELYKSTYNKEYTTEKELYRRTVFESHVKFIQKHNLEADLGKHTYTVGINEFSDLTSEEFTSRFNGFKMDNSKSNGTTFIEPNFIEIPESVDWRKKGYVTPIKNQLNCGSCWAFSTTGSLEGQHFRKTGKLVSLSESNLVDCSGKFGNLGCFGGLMDNAFKYIRANRGIDTEKSYPYRPTDGPCRFKRSTVGATCSGYVDIPTMNEKALQKAVATVGPISVAIDASSPGFHNYKSGIYVDRFCSSTALDHGVLAVGYGTTNGKDYWIVKNSWGTSWGDKGYIQMARNHNNMCGIATKASYPLV